MFKLKIPYRYFKYLTIKLCYILKFKCKNDSDKEIILHACNSLLFSDNNVWKKKNNDIFFDGPMESLHDAEICDLVGLYILSKLGNIFSNCNLYRDYGLGVIDLAKPVVYDRTRKHVYRFQNYVGSR